MANLSIKEMINAGVHFGHQSKYWNPKMRPYIYTTYKKLHIINLEESLAHFNTAISFVEKLTKNNAKILFVGTKRAARELIVKHAVEAKMPYVNNRWLGGMLTNFDTIKKSIAKLDSLKAALDLATLNGLTKKESLNIKKQIARLEKNLSGIKNLDKVPDALFVVDTRYEKIAIQEANKLHIPVIALVDSNNSFDGVDYMIPANDDAMSSINLFMDSISKVILDSKPKKVAKDSSATEQKKSIKAKKVLKTTEVKKVSLKVKSTSKQSKKNDRKDDDADE